MVWDPKRITRKEWSEAALFFRNLEDRNSDFQPLRELVEHVALQRYAASLGAAVSGTALLVAPRDAVEWGASCLRIDVSLAGAVQLTAAGRPTSSPPPGRGALAAAFERAVRDAGWA